MCSAALTCLSIVAVIAQVEETKRPPARPRPDIAVVLEDNGDELLPKLTNPTGCPGEGHVEKDNVFSGKSCVRIVPMQRFSPGIPEWNYRIVEKPKEGEYRYLRFAWKAPGCAGIMLQLHDLTDWHIRYTAGLDKHGWGTQYVAPKPPGEWTVVTVDLFKDFGERRIKGMALTCFDGEAGYFDHIYFGRSVDDLDRIDATGLSDGPPVELTAVELANHWRAATAGDEAAAGYRSFWTMAAAPGAVPFLAQKLKEARETAGVTAIKKWIVELDDDSFATREKASANLAKCLHLAKPLLQRELEKTESAEVRSRAAALLKAESSDASPSQNVAKAVTILELVATPDATQALTALASGDPDDQVTVLARAALQRMKPRQP